MLRAPGTERGQPGLQGPRGRAEGQRRRPGSGQGRRAGVEARGLRAEGTAFGESTQPGRGGHSPTSFQRTVLFPGKSLASLGVYFMLGGRRLSPHRPVFSLRFFR